MPSRRPVRLLLLALALPLLTVVEPAPPPAAAGVRTAQSVQAAQAVPVRVMHYNIRHGSFGLGRVAEDIRRTGAQVVLLNEVDDHTRTGGRHQARWLARRLGMTAVYHRTIRFARFDRGNAVLTRFAVRDVRRHALPHGPLSRPRGLMQVRLATRGTAFDVWTTHLSPTGGTYVQARRTSRLIGAPTCATVLGADVNARPGSREDRALRTHLRDLWRLRGSGPGPTNFRSTVRIDYLYVDRVGARSVRLTPLRGSDHRGVVGDLRISRAQGCGPLVS